MDYGRGEWSEAALISTHGLCTMVAVLFVFLIVF